MRFLQIFEEKGGKMRLKLPPFEVIMKSLTQPFLSNLSFTHKQLSMLKLLGRYQGKQALFYEQSPEVLESLQKVSVIESTESSNRIEGITAPHNRITDLVLKDTKPLVLIPAFVLDFLCIHPFRDGNGLCSRLLALLLLYHFGYEVGRYISLERVFEESKESYYDALGESSHGWHEGQHDILPWIGYFWGVLLKAYRELEERVGVITSGKGSKTEQVKIYVQKILRSVLYDNNN